MRTHRTGTVLALVCAVAATPLRAQNPTTPQAPSQKSVAESVMGALEWRSIGPANMSGRVTDVEGLPSPSKTFYVAAAAGGIWKTTNNGITFRPLFQNERLVSMGDLAIAPSDTLQIWAGTGEEDSRNSISPGGGIYKSTDGGLTWKLMGLEKTQAIGRILVHPTNPNIVYVAALGAPWNTNPERGLYKTTDGGQTWQLVKFISDKAGFVDMVMDPRNPDVIFAASWERIRTPYSLNSGGPGSALWQTTDGGKTWNEVKGGGFPATMKGRIGLAIAQSNPDVMYALVEASPPSGKGDGCRAAVAGGCGLYRSMDAGKTWEWMAGNDVRPFYYSQVRVDPERPNRVYWSSTPVNFSDDGGKTIRNTTQGLHVDHHAMWIDPKDGDRIVVGNDGGVGISFDRGGNWDFPNTFAIGQFYEVSYDMARPYNVCGGLQDNGSWCGPSRWPRGGITNSMWFTFNGGDGFFTAQDPRDPNIIYGESQGGNMARVDLRTNESTRLQKPSWRQTYIMLEDSILIARGDTLKPITPAQQKQIEAWRTRQKADSTGLEMRWNWNTPFLLSPHNPDVFYAAANRVLKSTKRGDDLKPISGDLTTRDTMRIRVSTQTTGGVTSDVTGAETFSTIVVLAESYVKQGMLFVGTDDGLVWVSPDDGKTWNNLTSAFKGKVPAGTYVRRIEPSHVDANRFYVAFDGHRTGDYTPYLFVTEDGGKTFRSIVNNLPKGGPDFLHVVREDPVNPDLLYVGTDVGAYVSLDRGASWQKFMNGLPTTPVHDLKIHPRDRELIAATHGRSIWIVDVAPLQELTPAVIAAAEPRFFVPVPAANAGRPPIDGQSTGQKWFMGESRALGAEFVYYNPKDAGGRSTIVIQNAKNDTVQVLNGPGAAGLQRLSWNLRTRPAPRAPLSVAEKRDSVRSDQRLTFVGDSLIKAGLDSAVVNRTVRQMRSGQGVQQFGGGGGNIGGTGRRVWVDRPGESAPIPQRGGAGGAPGGEDAQRVLQAFRDAGVRGAQGGGGGGFGGAQPPLVEPGTYTVTLKLGDRTLVQKLVVEKP